MYKMQVNTVRVTPTCLPVWYNDTGVSSGLSGPVGKAQSRTTHVEASLPRRCRRVSPLVSRLNDSSQSVAVQVSIRGASAILLLLLCPLRASSPEIDYVQGDGGRGLDRCGLVVRLCGWPVQPSHTPAPYPLLPPGGAGESVGAAHAKKQQECLCFSIRFLRASERLIEVWEMKVLPCDGCHTPTPHRDDDEPSDQFSLEVRCAG